MPSNVSGYDVANSRNIERAANALDGIYREIRRIADLLATHLEPAAPEEPPDVSWVETEEVKRDYGRDRTVVRDANVVDVDVTVQDEP